jgi:hypothetical protein
MAGPGETLGSPLPPLAIHPSLAHLLQNAVFENITVHELMIPDTWCSGDDHSGYQCPTGTVAVGRDK